MSVCDSTISKRIFLGQEELLLTAVQNIESGKISKSKTVGYLGDKILIPPLLSDTNYGCSRIA